MVSTVSSFGGLSAADVQMLFGASSSSSSSSATSASAVQSAPTSVSAAGANDPANAIKAILARAQIEQAQAESSRGGSAVSVTAELAYAVQMGGSDFQMSANATFSSPDAVQSIASEQWGINVAAEAVCAALSASNADDPANGITAISAQERIGRGATDPWGGGLVVSVLGGAESATEPSSSSSVASASATFLAPNAYQQLVSGGGSPTTLAEAAYAAQMGGSSSLGSANVTLSLPDTAQQIAYAVALLSAKTVFSESTGAITVTAADAVNVTVSNGNVSLTGARGAALPSGLPSLANMQQAIDTLVMANPQSYPARNGLDLSTYEGSLTLVQLPPDSNFACGDNYITFSTGGDKYNNWALVLPQDTVSATVSDTQIKG